ncbi:hypothetical protein JKP88DRAFT_248277 [Tribonema minus]|uniref:Uncharacterized protein n=1 Tax=Tribonema minus TaxID=303371 RepID=A0A835YMQ1_9STRA|nr:hypothetical protein JKP88DRAFT_248277 [Tribonema minus]
MQIELEDEHGIAVRDLQRQNGQQQERLRQLQEVNKQQRVASEQQQGRLRELEEQNRQLAIGNQQRATEAQQRQQRQVTNGVRTAHGVKFRAPQHAGMLGGGVQGYRQISPLPSPAKRNPQPSTTATTSSSGGGDAHTAAVTGLVREALTAPGAGEGDDDCSGDDHNIHSLDDDAEANSSVSQEEAQISCQESEADSTYIDSDSGERAGSTCDKRPAGDAGSGASSDAWDSDSSNSVTLARKCARIAGPANGIPRRQLEDEHGIAVRDLQQQNGQHQERLRQLEDATKAHAAAVTKLVRWASAARGAGGGDDDGSGDDHSVHSLDDETEADSSVSQDEAENSHQESEVDTDAGGSDASDSTYIDSDSGERAGSTCDKRSAGDAGSGASSDAWDSDSSNNVTPARNSRIQCFAIAPHTRQRWRPSPGNDREGEG